MENHETDRNRKGENSHDEKQFNQGESGILDPNSTDGVFRFLLVHDSDFGILPDSLLCLCGLTGELVLEVGLALAHDRILACLTRQHCLMSSINVLYWW